MLESRGIFSLAWILKALESPPHLREVSIDDAESRRTGNEREEEEAALNVKVKPYL